MDGQKIDPKIAPLSERSTWRERARALPEVGWILLVFIVVVGGIMNGFFTPTEAGGIGTFAVLLLAIVKRGINFKGYVKSLREALGTAVMILMLIMGSVILGHFIAVTNIPQKTADWVVQLPVNRYVVLFMICIMYEIGGSFIDDLAFMILATPSSIRSHEARLRPYLVRDRGRCRRYDRSGYSAGGCLCFCGKKHHQGAHRPIYKGVAPSSSLLSLSGAFCSSFRNSLSGFLRRFSNENVPPADEDGGT